MERRIVDVVAEVGDHHAAKRDLEAAEQREEEIVRERARRRHAVERQRDGVELGGSDHHRKGPPVALAAEQDHRRLRRGIEVGGQDLHLLEARDLGLRHVAPVARGALTTREAGQNTDGQRDHTDAAPHVHDGSFGFTEIRLTRACAPVYPSVPPVEWSPPGGASRTLTPAPASMSAVRIAHMNPYPRAWVT